MGFVRPCFCNSTVNLIYYLSEFSTQWLFHHHNLFLLELLLTLSALLSDFTFSLQVCTQFFCASLENFVLH